MENELVKGQRINLFSSNHTSPKIVCKFGWDSWMRGFGRVDCDFFAIMLQDGKLMNDSDVITFKNLKHPSKCVIHGKDRTSNRHSGDDEKIIIKLDEIPLEYTSILLGVNIYNASKRNQHFGDVEGLRFRIQDKKSMYEICRYNMVGNYSECPSIVIGSIYKYDCFWKFHAVGTGVKDTTIEEISRRHRGEL